MAEKPSSTLAVDLRNRFATLDRTRKEVERLAAKGILSRRTIEHTYEGLFLRVHLSFEHMLEDLFVGLLVAGKGLKSSRSDIFAKVEIRSHPVARQILIGPNRHYTDWLPYENTIKRAKMFFRGGRPFTDLHDTEKDQLLKAVAIRNVIAHRSRHSITKFKRLALGGVSLPPHQRSPAGFLRGVYRASPAQTRFENILVQLSSIATKLTR